MLRSHQSQSTNSGAARRAASVGGLLVAALLAGCSADIARLDSPRYGLNSGPVPSEPIGRHNAGAPPAYDNSGWSNSGPRATAPTPAPGYDRVASLPDASAPLNGSHPFDAPKRSKPASVATAAATHPAAGHRPGAVPVVGGATVDVQQGDSLSSISKHYHVSIAALMELNGLKSASLKPGQKLQLPSTARRPIARAPDVAPAAAVGQTAASTPMRAAKVPPPASVPAEPAADWNGNYVVKSGDSLYGIARAHKVTVAELQRANGVADALKIKPGMNLKVPAAAEAVAAPAPMAATGTDPAAPAAPVGVRLLNPPPGIDTVAADATPAAPAPTKVAVLGPVPVPVAPPVAAPAALPAKQSAEAARHKFDWPARGTLLAGFGQRPDGAQNDGINIAVQAGTDIKAADTGTVAYAGSEIKAYGNLVLLRHDNGWVTAYAHADKILVKRGDIVKRGQVIAKAGSTGSVDQPQVHFELRQGSKPIDPAPHMEK